MHQAGIVIYNPKIINLFGYKFYGGPHKGGFRIVNYNPRRTYCPLVPKRDTFNATKGSPQPFIQYTGEIVDKKEIWFPQDFLDGTFEFLPFFGKRRTLAIFFYKSHLKKPLLI